MKVTADQIKKLREKCGAGVMECRMALEEAAAFAGASAFGSTKSVFGQTKSASQGKLEEKALRIINEKGLEIAEKKKERETKQGLMEIYSHAGGKVVSVVELLCETDFVAKNEGFKTLAHELAMQVAAMNPASVEELLEQEYIRDPNKKVADLLNALIAKIRENIKLGRIARFELGE